MAIDLVSRLPLAGQRRARGRVAEASAAADLERRGYRIVARNARLGHDELDIVALRDDTLVIVEVRMRSRTDYGGAAASIGPRKRQRLQRAAERWLQRHPHSGPVRIDVCLVDAAQRLEWIENAVDGG